MKRLALISLLASALALTIAVVVRAQDAAVDPRMAAYDKGPAKIDVSKYPADMQAKYKKFEAKCGKSCHPLARSINCELASDDEWERSVKRMMRKAGTLITPEDGKEIFEFLVYDSKIRKKDLYERKLQESAPVKTSG